MSKQVILVGSTLEVRTRLLETQNAITRVKVTRKGCYDQYYYQYPEHALNDLENLKQATICGHRVIDLIIVAERLRANGVNIMELKTYTDGFKDGYARANADYERALQACINDTLKSLKDAQGAEGFKYDSL